MRNCFKVFFIFFILGLLVYFNSLNNKFLLDDYVFLNNPVMSGTKFILSQWDPFREQALGVTDSEEHLGYYRPMAHIVYDICYATFKNNFWQYHLLNIFLFVLASLLIYLFLEKTTGNISLAFLTGLLYLIHPINGIVVNYISASVFSFQVIFTLMTILLLIEALERNNDRMFYGLSLLFSFFSLFWHESSVMIPFYISAFVFIFRRESIKGKLHYLLPYYLIVFFYMLFRFLFIRVASNVWAQVSFFHLTGGEYLASLFKIFMWYLAKLFYPQGIVMQWRTLIVHDHIILYSLGLSLFFMVFLLIYIRFAKQKILQLALIWLLIGFVPVFLASIVRLYDGFEIEPHWFIFSSIGFFMIVAYACLIILDRTRKIGAVLLFVLIFSWGSISHANNQLWADQKTYCLYWSAQVPDFKIPLYTLAIAYHKEGDFKKAKDYYRRALSGYPSDDGIYVSLGTIDSSLGDFKEAQSNYKKALQLNPQSSFAYYGLGRLYLKLGQWKNAGENFSQALVYNPLLVEARSGLAQIYYKNSDYKESVRLSLMNLDIINDDPESLGRLADSYWREGDFVDSKKYLIRIINIDTDPQDLTKLEGLMAQHHSYDVAFDCFRRLIRVAPDYKNAYLVTGAILANLGKYDDAIHLWKMGETLDPSDQSFKENIAKAIKLSHH